MLKCIVSVLVVTVIEGIDKDFSGPLSSLVHWAYVVWVILRWLHSMMKGQDPQPPIVPPPAVEVDMGSGTWERRRARASAAGVSAWKKIHFKSQVCQISIYYVH